MKYIDAHGHIQFPIYDGDRAEILASCQDLGVGMVAVGTGIETSKMAVDLAHKHKNIWACVGLHPIHETEIGSEIEEDFDFESYKSLASDPKVVGIGECGLDYFHSQPEDIAHQREIFDKHIELANSVGKPLMLHVRNGKNGGSAYKEALEMIVERAKVPFDFHFFAGTVDDAKSICEKGGYVSFTGVVTFARNYDEIIRTVPIDRIMSETDCPYVAPIPYRGQTNRPDYVVKIVQSLALIRGIPTEEMGTMLLSNAKKFYGLV